MGRPEGIEKILRSVSSITTISIEKLGKEYDLLVMLSEISQLCQDSVTLFGGTALNLFYFGKNQRLSYDIDLKTHEYQKVHSIFTKHYKKTIETDTFVRFETPSGIVIDLSREPFDVQGTRLKASSVFDMTSNSLFDVYFFVYPFEHIFADKILALGTRGTTRDVYDAWIGMKLINNKDAFRSLLIESADKRKVDPRLIITKHHHIDTDMTKVDSLVPKLDGVSMYKEVQNFIRELFFEET